MKRVIATALFAMLSTITHADVKLNVDEHIKVMAINGQEIRHGVLQPLKREFTLDAGRHVITARYDRLFELSRGDHDYLKSGNITITVDLADNQHYQLTMPNQPNNYAQAKEYVRSPTLAIVQGQTIIAKEQHSEQRAGIISSISQGFGGLFNRGSSAIQDNQQTIAAINQDAQNSQPQPTPATPSGDNLDHFMQIWLQADEAEREKIRQWIGK